MLGSVCKIMSGDNTFYLLRRRADGHLDIVPLAGLSTQVVYHVHEADADRCRPSPPPHQRLRMRRMRQFGAGALPQWQADGEGQARGVRRGSTPANQTQHRPQAQADAAPKARLRRHHSPQNKSLQPRCGQLAWRGFKAWL